MFTHRALLLCEEATGIDTLSASLADPSMSLLRGLLYGVLSAAGASCSLAEAGREIAADLGKTRRTIVDAWIAAMADPARQPYRQKVPKGADEPGKLTWVRKWAYETSRDGLAVPDDRWLDMTPRQVQELEILRLRQQQREEYLLGILAAQVENYSPVHPKAIAKPESFMLHKLDPDQLEAMGTEDERGVGDRIAAYYSQFPAKGDAGPAPPPEERVPVILGAAPINL